MDEWTLRQVLLYSQNNVKIPVGQHVDENARSLRRISEMKKVLR